MLSSLDAVLAQYRTSAKTIREKGIYFQDLIQNLLAVDPRHSSQFEKIETDSIDVITL